MNYYNEHDPKAAAWLRELISAGLIPAGDVDTRSITEVSPDEIAHYTQCHFFAGIGGWSLALELAGWPATRPVWTGSCPCQPFSAAGQGKGGSDDRHLWPVFCRLIAKLHPQRVFGEQVAQAIGFNWLDGVSADLEADGYAVGAAVLGAHSVGSPHIRQRLYWVADSQREGLERLARNGHDGYQPGRVGEEPLGRAAQGRESLRMADTQHNGGRSDESGRKAQGGNADGGACAGIERLADPESAGSPSRSVGTAQPKLGASGGLGDTAGGGCGILWDEAQPGSGRHAIGASWARFEIVHCRDGKARRFEPGSFPLAHGLPGRVGLLRGYGNAIVPQVAAEFIRAVEEVISTHPPL
jgi:DNA (cytosine-5)-methyltransferase 1